VRAAVLPTPASVALQQRQLRFIAEQADPCRSIDAVFTAPQSLRPCRRRGVELEMFAREAVR
jgi:hypothetical protein